MRNTNAVYTTKGKLLCNRHYPQRKENQMSQHERILDYINTFGSISPMEAFNDLGITKLSTRIGEMRADGINFNQEWEIRKNRYGEKVRYMRYSRG